MKEKRFVYEIGDIVFASRYLYSNDQEGENHLFVLIDVEENKVVPIEYFGMLVSSNMNKCRGTSKYKYNEPLIKKEKNGLKKDSIVKCDQIYSVTPDNIRFKIGSVDVDDYIRFVNAYHKMLRNINAK